ncbi:class I SAM-dependent methyltransferase [Escherichia coli]
MSAPATILDMCCGSRMFWFDKSDERAIFSDIRKEGYTLRNGRRLIISPDIIADFRALSFANASFSMVVLDPPHLESVGDNAWMGKKYGRLNKDVKWSTKTGHRVRVFSSIDFPIRLVVTHHYIRAVLVRCNIQRYSPLLRELHR